MEVERQEVRRIHCYRCHSWAGRFYTAQGKHHLSLHTNSFCSSYNCYKPLSFQARAAISVSAQVRNLCSDPQTQSSGIHHQTPPKCRVFQRHHCRHSCAIQTGQGVTQVSKILRTANCLVTMCKGSKLFSDYVVYCASGFWLRGVAILPSLPWAMRATKAFVLDWCLGKSAES